MSTDQTRQSLYDSTGHPNQPLHDSTRHPNQPLHDITRHTSQSQIQSQPLHESAPGAYQTIKFMTAASIGATLTVLFGLTLTGTVLALILVTPLLVLFSPVLVPAAIVAVLATGGFVLSGVFGVAALAALVWLYSYTTGKHPAWSDQLDYARARIGNKAREIGQYGQDMARDATNKAREMGQYGQDMARDATNKAREMGRYGQDMARDATNKAREMGRYGQDMARDATNQGAAAGERHNYVEVS